MHDATRYPYRPKIMVIILSGLFFVAATWVIGHRVLRHSHGITFNDVLTFSLPGSIIFDWILFFASLLFVIMSLTVLYRAKTTTKQIVVTDTELIAPKSFISRQVITIKFSDIIDVDIQVVHGQVFLNILHANGLLTVPQSVLPDKQTFMEFAAHMIAKAAINRENETLA